ncbi:MAG: hypothetical protein IH955_05780 [Chloroflexi bacterium]|nr:hypothetical protein [Chloroflexota bacterium]
MEKFTNRLIEYQGLLSLGLDDDVRENGYFECVQTVDGMITLVGHFPKAFHQPAGLMSCSIAAADTNGWYLQTEGKTFCTSSNLRSSRLGPSTALVIKPTRIRATLFPEITNEFLNTRFAIANLLLSQSTNTIPSPIDLSHPKYRITINGVELYKERAASLRAIPGIEHTADIEIKRKDGKRHSLDEAVELMDELVYPFRLWCGNKLDWLYGEGLDDLNKTPVKRIHKDGVISTFSNTLLGLGWYVDLALLSESYFKEPHELDIDRIKNFVNYFVDVCARGPYLETKALAAATLLDSLSALYATVQDKDNILPAKQFQEAILPKLREAIDSLALRKELKAQLKGNLLGLYRKSFRNRLKFLMGELDIKISNQTRQVVINTRNELVHLGQFPDKGPVDPYTAYIYLLWVDYAALCKLLGYAGYLPTPLSRV